MMQVHIRWMIRRDYPEVLAIEAASFEAPWSEEDFARTLRERNCIGMVVRHTPTQKVVGFVVYELHKQSLEVLNLAVHPDYRLCGVGRQMVAKLQGKLSSHRRLRIELNVRESNLGCQKWLRSLGFRAVKVLRGWYTDHDEDAFRFVFDVDDVGGADTIRVITIGEVS